MISLGLVDHNVELLARFFIISIFPTRNPSAYLLVEHRLEQINNNLPMEDT